MKGLFDPARTSLSVYTYRSQLSSRLFFLLKVFIAYKIPVFLCLIKYTSPKLPFPSFLNGKKSSSYTFECSFKANEALLSSYYYS